MVFSAVEALEKLVQEIEGKVPTEITDFFDEEVEFLKANGIHDMMHIGKTEWTRKEAAEWLLSMFIGTVEKGRQNIAYYGTFPNWLTHADHFVIKNTANLPEE